jgi:hypothetical protein
MHEPVNLGRGKYCAQDLLEPKGKLFSQLEEVRACLLYCCTVLCAELASLDEVGLKCTLLASCVLPTCSPSPKTGNSQRLRSKFLQAGMW